MAREGAQFEVQAVVPTKRPERVYWVAPDPDAITRGQLGLEEQVNTLAICPIYKIQIGLGEFEWLFPKPPGDADRKFFGKDTAGNFANRKARLQVAGLFYRPLDHPEAHDCFDVVWSYFKSKRHLTAPPTGPDAAPFDDARGDQALVKMIREHVVEGGKLPAPDAVARIRLPGGYTYVDQNPHTGTVHPYFNNDTQRYADEEKYYAANPVLGKIPIVAHVSKMTPDGRFVDAPGVTVYFQLIPPKSPMPSGSVRVRPRDTIQPNQAPQPPTPPLPPGGPAAYIDQRRENYQIDRTDPPEKRDPQGFNAHFNLGGKRGMNGADGKPTVGGKTQTTIGAGDQVDRPNLFATESIEGFNEKHDDGRDLGHKDYPVAEHVEPEGDDFKHCVRALTNEDGEAGVIFMPSRVAGDRYRIRAFVGPPTIHGNGTEDNAVKVETGTMIVWRTIRLSRNLQHEAPAVGDQFSQTFTDEYNAVFGLSVTRQEMANFYHNGGLGTVDLDLMRREYAKAYCEFIVEHGARQPVDLATIQNEWRAAHDAGVLAAEKDSYNLNHRLNVAKLYHFDPQSPITFNLHSPKAYNDSNPATAVGSHPTGRKLVLAPPNTPPHASNAERLLVHKIHTFYLVPAFLRSMCNSGYLPGLTFIRAPRGSTWDTYGQQGTDAGNVQVFSTSGVAYGQRACFIWLPLQEYIDGFPYPMLSNVYHEVGHCLYFEHAPGGGAGGVRADRHDTSDVCVLSYADCVGDYCGHCLGALMGFDETSADFKPGPPPPPSPPAPSPGGSPGGPSRPGLAGRGRSAPAPGPGIESVVDAPEPKVTE